MNSQATSVDRIGDRDDISLPGRSDGMGHSERFLVMEYRLTGLEKDMRQLATKSDLMALQLVIMERFGELKSRLDKSDAERTHMATKADVQVVRSRQDESDAEHTHMATKADVQAVRTEINDAKISLLRWGLGGLLSFLAGWSLIIKYFILP